MPDPIASGTGYLMINSWLQSKGEERGWGVIEKINKNILIRNSINRYLIKLSSGKFDGNYDIIDCKHSNYVKIILLKNKVLVTN